MKRAVLWTLGILTAWLLLIALLLSCVQWRVSSNEYFRKQYAKHHVTEDVQMEMDDLLLVTDHMMAYLFDTESDLQIETTIDGKENVPFFNEKEIRHMKDVKDLFNGGRTLRRICLLAASISLLLFLYQKQITLFLSSLRVGILLGLLCGGGFLGLMTTNFSKYFINFHLLFFDNDDWILNYRTDRLINIVPESFFSDTAFWIGGSFLAAALLALLLIHMYLQKRKRKE